MGGLPGGSVTVAAVVKTGRGLLNDELPRAFIRFIDVEFAEPVRTTATTAMVPSGTAVRFIPSTTHVRRPTPPAQSMPLFAELRVGVAETDRVAMADVE